MGTCERGGAVLGSGQVKRGVIDDGERICRQPAAASGSRRTYYPRDSGATGKEADVMGCVCASASRSQRRPLLVKVGTTNRLVPQD